MDDIYEISNLLNNENVENVDKELYNKLKISLNETMEEIDILLNDNEYLVKSKIENLEKLLNQINQELIKNTNYYLLNLEKYKFPNKLKILNEEISNKQKLLIEKKDIKDTYKKSLIDIINKKEELSNKILCNTNNINDKKLKINNNCEITSIVEKKKQILGRKKNNDNTILQNISNKECELSIKLNEYNKNIMEIEKHHNNEKNEINIFLNRDLCYIQKIPHKSIEHKSIGHKSIGHKSIEHKSIEYKIKKKEIESLQKRLIIIEKEKQDSIKHIETEMNNETKLLDKFKMEMEIIKLDETEKANQDILLLDPKLNELNIFFTNLKDENIIVLEELSKLEKKEKLIELELFSIDIDEIIKDINSIELIIKKQQIKTVQQFNSFKNKHNNTIDKLKEKKYRLNKKIEILKNKSKENKDLDSLISRKKFIIKLLNNEFIS
uniref:Uncharacterized protein n=1 Tax=viral metagenome TaxID=1070528 RepID=A0A6C0J959_9ZZZZ